MEACLHCASQGEQICGQQSGLVEHKVHLQALHLHQLLSCLQHLGGPAHSDEQEGVEGKLRLPWQALWLEAHCP